MGLIPEEIISQVLEGTNIAEVIAGYIPLKRAGKNFKANCPFHHEKTPSFIVNPDKQIFHCFGCHVGGNVIGFIMRQERMEFPEAIRLLAEKINIIIPKDSSFDNETLSLRELLYKANTEAAQFFQQNLLGNHEDVGPVVKYLKNRGVALETVKKLQLGFARDKWDDLLNYLRRREVSIGIMEKAGLIIPKEKGEGFYDRFRDRIIFPIFDIKARCVGFGARARKEGQAKYINSPETAVYTKGQHLYGFHLAKEAVREKDFAIIVEGYMDFLIPFQAGVLNIVASLGTALTVEQIRLLNRYSKNVVMLFDADAAGENAMVRSFDLLIEEGMNVKVAALPAGEDPDSFVRKSGVEAFNEKVIQALPLFDYKMKVLTGRYSQKTVEGKTKIAAEMLPTIGRFTNAVTKFGYIKQLAHMLAIAEEPLLVELQKVGSPISRKFESGDKKPILDRPNAAERNLLKLVLENETFLSDVKEKIDLSDLQDEKVKFVMTELFMLMSQGKEVIPSAVINRLANHEVAQMISQLLAGEEQEAVDKTKIFRDCVTRIKDNRLKILRRDLSEQIKLAEVSGDHAKLDELKEKFNQSIKR